MAKVRKAKRSRFDGIDLNTLNQEAAKVTGQADEVPKDVNKITEPVTKKQSNPVGSVKKMKTQTSENLKEETRAEDPSQRGRGRPKSSSRKPLNTAIEPKNRQRLEFLAMLNGGSVADQLNDILERYFTEVEKVDELIAIFEARKKKL